MVQAMPPPRSHSPKPRLGSAMVGSTTQCVARLYTQSSHKSLALSTRVIIIIVVVVVSERASERGRGRVSTTSGTSKLLSRSVPAPATRASQPARPISRVCPLSSSPSLPLSLVLPLSRAAGQQETSAHNDEAELSC